MVVEDLSFYAKEQFLPMLIMPVILIFSRSHYDITAGYWLLLIAKVFEKYDHETHDFLGFISGHSLKRLFAELGIYLMILMRIDRKKIG